MEASKNQTIYLISGPCGVGKSTLSQLLVNRLLYAALVEGDQLMDMLDPVADKIGWDHLLKITWENISATTKVLLRNQLNIVIDYVVEEELEWFCGQLAEFDVTIKYIVLVADDHILKERINKRGDVELIDRSLFLRKKLGDSVFNKNYIIDTTGKNPSEVCDIVVNSNEFVLDKSAFKGEVKIL